MSEDKIQKETFFGKGTFFDVSSLPEEELGGLDDAASLEDELGGTLEDDIGEPTELPELPPETEEDDIDEEELQAIIAIAMQKKAAAAAAASSSSANSGKSEHSPKATAVIPQPSTPPSSSSYKGPQMGGSSGYINNTTLQQGRHQQHQQYQQQQQPQQQPSMPRPSTSQPHTIPMSNFMSPQQQQQQQYMNQQQQQYTPQNNPPPHSYHHHPHTPPTHQPQYHGIVPSHTTNNNNTIPLSSIFNSPTSPTSSPSSSSSNLQGGASPMKITGALSAADLESKLVSSAFPASSPVPSSPQKYTQTSPVSPSTPIMGKSPLQFQPPSPISINSRNGAPANLPTSPSKDRHKFQNPIPIMYPYRTNQNRCNFSQMVKSTKYMPLSEVECILQIQEQQLLSSNPFIDDFYYQAFYAKMIGKGVALPATSSIPSVTETLLTDRDPIYDIATYTSYTRRPNDSGRVLGRIPSYNMRAPRTVLEIKNIDGNAKEQMENYYKNSNNSKLIIENVYDDVLDLEDINSILLTDQNISSFLNNQNSNNNAALNPQLLHILKSTPKLSPDRITALNQKKLEIIASIEKKISLFIPSADHQPTKKENWLCQFEEDEALLKLFFIPKGIKLVTRLIPLLTGNLMAGMVFFFMRNFFILITICNRSEASTNNKFFFAVAENVRLFPIIPSILAFQTILSFHNAEVLVHTLKKKEGSYVITTLLNHIHQSFRSNVEMYQNTELGRLDIRSFWANIVNELLSILLPKMPILFDGLTNSNDFDRICSFVAAVAQSASSSQKRMILAHLSEKLSEILSEHPEWGASAQLLVSILFDDKEIL